MHDSQQIAKELKQNLYELYPDRIEKIILFGSSLIHKMKSEQDIDILVVLKDDSNSSMKEFVYEQCSNINLKYDVWIDIHIINKNEIKTIRGKQPFVQRALVEGIKV